jgi:hypothetical protein
MNITNTFEHSDSIEKYCNILNTMTDDYRIRNYYENYPLEDWCNSEYKLEDENVFGVDEVYIKENTDKNEYLLIDDVEKVGLNRYIGVIKAGTHIAAEGVIYKKTNNGIEILSIFNRVDNQIYITDNINYNKLFKKENNIYYTEDFSRKCELIVERDHTKQDVKYGIIQTNSEKIEILFKYTDYGIYITEYNATYTKMIDDNKLKRYNLFKDSHKIVHTLKNVLNNDVKDVTIDDYDIIVENPNVIYIYINLCSDQI